MDDKLSQWLNLKKSVASGTGFKKLPADERAPLSYGQLRLWFLQQMNPGNPFYHYAEQYSIEGELRQEHFINCFRKIISRHHILRTTFLHSEGVPWQQVNDALPPEIMEIDLRQVNKKEAADQVNDITQQEATRPFDLDRGPLIRLVLFQLEDQSYRLTLVMHHIIADQWSMDIIREEWAALYRGQEPDPGRDLRYVDFAFNQRHQPVNKDHRQFWERKLAGTLPQLEFPLSKKRNQTNVSYRGSTHQWDLPVEICGNLQTFCRETSTTMFVVMLSVFKTLIYRYTGEPDILVATPVTNRDKVMLERMIGFFNETIILRDHLSGGMTFLDLVKAVQATVLEAFAHKDIPFESIVRSLKPERMISNNPLFQVMFLYHRDTGTPFLDESLKWDFKPVDIGVSKFDLTLHIHEDGDRLKAIIEYALDIFTPAAIKKMQGHLDTLISGILKNPGLPLSQLPLITDGERTQILSEWNHPVDHTVPYHSIMDLLLPAFEKHLQRTAVASTKLSLTYAELDRLAGYYASLLPGPDIKVGICTGRSPEMIVGMLAALKSGAPYVPMDSSYPISRLKHMIEDAGISVILTEEHLKHNFSGLPLKTIPISLKVIEPSGGPHHHLASTSGSSMAYIMYTSGSTGMPKGVPITHHNLVSSTLARISYYPEKPGVFLLMSSFSFDSSVAGIFWTLCSGGTLVLPEDRIEQDMVALSELIEHQRVTHTLLLPSLYNLLLQHGITEKLNSLDTVIVAGETCHAETSVNHFKILPKTNLYNEYGPTEATVWSTVYQVHKPDIEGIIPIGRPIENSKVYLLDQSLNLVPAGVTGEIYICGNGVSSGYLNLPEQTRSSYIPSPFSYDNGRLMYRTGDLGRYRENGLIEFLGRADHQIKLRGYRVEPGEISKVIMKFPGIDESVVVLKQVLGTENTSESSGSEALLKILEDMDPEQSDSILRSVESISQFNFTG